MRHATSVSHCEALYVLLFTAMHLKSTYHQSEFTFPVLLWLRWCWSGLKHTRTSAHASKLWIHQQMRTVIIHSSDLHVDVQFSFNWQLTAAIMTLTIREIGRCWKEVGEQSRGPVSLGINLATGSTNRLSPPISRQRTDSYLYCQVAAAAAPQKREDSSKKLRRIGTPVKQNAMQQDTFGCLETSEAFASTDFT